MGTKIIEYRGSGFYGNRPKRIIEHETTPLCGQSAAEFNPISWDKLLVRPKRKRRTRKCAR